MIRILFDIFIIHLDKIRQIMSRRSRRQLVPVIAPIRKLGVEGNTLILFRIGFQCRLCSTHRSPAPIVPGLIGRTASSRQG